MFSLLFSNTKMIVITVICFTIGSALFLGYRHYTNLLETVEVLTENNFKLEAAVEVQGMALDASLSAIDKWQTSQLELQKKVEESIQVSNEAQNELRRITNVFAKHNFTELSRRKPGLIERRINTGTDSSIRMLECASGAKYSYCSDRNKNP